MSRALLRVGSMPLLGNHSVDAVLAGEVPTGEEKLEVQPPAEADDHGARHITGSSGVPVGQQPAGYGRIRIHEYGDREAAGQRIVDGHPQSLIRVVERLPVSQRGNRAQVDLDGIADLVDEYAFHRYHAVERIGPDPRLDEELVGGPLGGNPNRRHSVGRRRLCQADRVQVDVQPALGVVDDALGKPPEQALGGGAGVDAATRAVAVHHVISGQVRVFEQLAQQVEQLLSPHADRLAIPHERIREHRDPSPAGDAVHLGDMCERMPPAVLARLVR